MQPDPSQLVIEDVVAAEVRRHVGVTAWAVLEVMAARSHVDRRERVVQCGARLLAHELGVSKDTVARGLRVLIDAGLVDRMDQRDLRSGRFTSTSYRLALSGSGVRVVAVPSAESRRPMAGSDGPPAIRDATEQLTLQT